MKLSKDYIAKYPNRVRYIAALVGFLFIVGLFASLADEVHEGDTLRFDRSVLVYLRSNVATPQLDAFMALATDLGGVSAISFVTAIIAILMWRKRMFSRAAVLLLSMGGIAAAVTILKVVFARERPSDVGQFIKESTFSFPSGHSMGSMGLALIIMLLLWQTRWRTASVIIGTVYIVFVGFSRLYLGVHYPTDVLAGWLLGAGWVVAVYTIFRSNRRFKV